MTMFSTLLEHDRRAAGFTVAQVARRIGVTPAVHRDLETGTRWPTSDAYHAVSALFG